MTELVVFTTPQCASCSLLKRDLTKLSQLHGFDYEVIQVAPDSIDLFKKYDVRRAPTMMLLDNGAMIFQIAGYYGELALFNRLVEWGVITDVHG